ncbi:alpha-protein kinase vwka [Anaeramoeba flamelloides]|uniref:Alpha-protein kinase vwka n=1 Tax=Anaeramoeba flamelloides TaxID=1746091 RepID=A0ABQ8Y496_9EUKA|nr:alpha-protein kinase vwka [Anaeramoeba flamelloides]
MSLKKHKYKYKHKYKNKNKHKQKHKNKHKSKHHSRDSTTSTSSSSVDESSSSQTNTTSPETTTSSRSSESSSSNSKFQKKSRKKKNKMESQKKKKKGKENRRHRSHKKHKRKETSKKNHRKPKSTKKKNHKEKKKPKEKPKHKKKKKNGNETKLDKKKKKKIESQQKKKKGNKTTRQKSNKKTKREERENVRKTKMKSKNNESNSIEKNSTQNIIGVLDSEEILESMLLDLDQTKREKEIKKMEQNQIQVKKMEERAKKRKRLEIKKYRRRIQNLENQVEEALKIYQGGDGANNLLKMIEEKRWKHEQQKILEMGKVALEHSIDICFILDATATMDPYIEKTRETIIDLVKEIRSKCDVIIRIGAIAYRDFNEDKIVEDVIEDINDNNKKKIVKRLDESEHFQLFDFTLVHDLGKFTGFLKTLLAYGGGDDPEDIFGALSKIPDLTWVSSARLVVHITDAPCHGLVYHDPEIDDEYPDGDPNNLSLKQLIWGLIGRSIHYCFVKLDERTDLMCQKFHEQYEKYKHPEYFEVQRLDNNISLLKLVNHSLNLAVKLKEKNKIDFLGALGFPISDKLENCQEDFFSYNEDDENKIDPETLWSQEFEALAIRLKPDLTIDDFNNMRYQYEFYNTKIKIHRQPLGKGNFRTAFKMKDTIFGENLVIKKFNEPVKNVDLLMQMCVKEMITQSFAKRLAFRFNQEKNGRAVDFLESFVYYIPELEGYQFMNVEPKLDGIYQKYSNNGEWKFNNEKSTTAHAFSHWTYSSLGENFMVVDLQGVGYILTDPAINYADNRGFSESDTGSKGIDKWFTTHICSATCTDLKLKRHKNHPPTNVVLSTQINQANYILVCSNPWCGRKMKVPKGDIGNKSEKLCLICKKIGYEAIQKRMEDNIEKNPPFKIDITKHISKDDEKENN